MFFMIFFSFSCSYFRVIIFLLPLLPLVLLFFPLLRPHIFPLVFPLLFFRLSLPLSPFSRNLSRLSLPLPLKRKEYKSRKEMTCHSEHYPPLPPGEDSVPWRRVEGRLIEPRPVLAALRTHTASLRVLV